MSIACGVFIGLAAENEPPFVLLFPLFGLLFICLGVGASVFSFNKARAYEDAHRLYLHRRDRLLEQISELRLEQ
jgi:hypothetical protein